MTAAAAAHAGQQRPSRGYSLAVTRRNGCSWPSGPSRPGQGVQGLEILHAGLRAARAGPNQYNGYDVTYVLSPLWAR